MEVQINGGSISDKVEFARELFEKKVPIKSTFAKDEMVDIIGVISITILHTVKA